MQNFSKITLHYRILACLSKNLWQDILYMQSVFQAPTSQKGAPTRYGGCEYHLSVY